MSDGNNYKKFNLQFQGNSFAPRFLDINGFNLHYETTNGIKTQKIKAYKKVSFGHNWDKKWSKLSQFFKNSNQIYNF